MRTDGYAHAPESRKKKSIAENAGLGSGNKITPTIARR
jgi:hypothetical protein